MWPTPPSEPALTLHMPVCPSTNNLFVARRDGKGRAKTTAYKGWEEAAHLILLGQSRRLIDGPVRVEILAPFSRRRDIDNCKPVLDLLTKAGVIQDDRYVDDLRIVRVPPSKSGTMMTVSLWPMP